MNNLDKMNYQYIGDDLVSGLTWSLQYGLAKGDTALHATVIFGYEVICLSLLKNGANPNIINSEGQTPLILAAKSGKVNMIPILLQFGAAIDMQGNDGDTSLLAAAKEGHTEAAITLVKKNADLNLRTFGLGNFLLIYIYM